MSNISSMRKNYFFSSLLFLFFGFIASATALDYPTKAVRFIVSFPAGGNADLISRLVAQGLSNALGKPFVIDNRGGAGGIVAEEITAKSSPDGYTMLEVSIAHVVNPNLNIKVPYDPIKDLAPISVVASVPNVLVVHNSVNAKTVSELIALAKAKPNQLNYASSQGTSLHLCAALFTKLTGVNIFEINYKSGALAIPDLEGGRVQMAFSSISTAISVVKYGRIRALAVTSAQRSKVIPDLPTSAEFVPGYEMTGWQAILVPAGTPVQLINRLSTNIASIIRQPEMQDRLISIGADPVGSSAEEFSRFRMSEFKKMTDLMVKVDFKKD